MLAREFGRIIFISSVWGVAGAAMESAYSMTKSALTGLTRSLAKETGGNVTVNCICPGVIDTPMNSRFNKDEISDLIDRTPAGRLGRPEEVAELAAFLASDKAAFITGQSIVIDGGFILGGNITAYLRTACFLTLGCVLLCTRPSGFGRLLSESKRFYFLNI